MRGWMGNVACRVIVGGREWWGNERDWCRGWARRRVGVFRAERCASHTRGSCNSFDSGNVKNIRDAASPFHVLICAFCRVAHAKFQVIVEVVDQNKTQNIFANEFGLFVLASELGGFTLVASCVENTSCTASPIGLNSDATKVATSVLAPCICL